MTFAIFVLMLAPSYTDEAIENRSFAVAAYEGATQCAQMAESLNVHTVDGAHFWCRPVAS